MPAVANGLHGYSVEDCYFTQKTKRLHSHICAGFKKEAIFGVSLMMLIINPNASWGTSERVICSLLLWHLIINWSGILESKPWLFISEIIRIALTAPALYFFSHLGEKPVWLALCVLYHVYCLLWTLKFFNLKNNTPITATPV
jgi:hypothetical protein